MTHGVWKGGRGLVPFGVHYAERKEEDDELAERRLLQLRADAIMDGLKSEQEAIRLTATINSILND